MTDSDFTAALQSLGSELAVGQIARQAYYEALVRLLHVRFKPSRVNIWRLKRAELGHGKVLDCVAEYSSHSPSALRRDSLTEAEFRPYLQVLARNGIYVSDDTLADPALAAMREGYLVPGKVLALMDAAITINGAVVGVVCCEELGRIRYWRQIEATALKRCIATVNVHLARLQASDDSSGGLFG